MKKLIKTTTTILTTILLSFELAIPAFAQDLSVTWEEEPLFYETDVKPCDEYTKTFTVTNTSTTDTYLFGIASYGEIDDDNLANEMYVEMIDQDGNILYGGPGDPKSLLDFHDETEFSDDPATPGTEIYLITVGPGETYIISVMIGMPCELGNEWQRTETSFNLGVGWTGSVLGEETEGEILGATGANIIPVILFATVLIYVSIRKIILSSRA